jgi:hypothetical protein
VPPDTPAEVAEAPLSVAAEAERMLDRRQHRAATAASTALVDLATQGEEVERDQVIAARRAEADAADWATFCATTSRAAACPIEAAHKGLAAAKDAAWGAIAQHGIRLRISAAMKADKAAAAHSSAGWGGTYDAKNAAEEKRRKAVNALEPEWRRGADFVDLAARSGWRFKAAVSVAVPECT